jgi:hypothetical protein
LLFSCTFNKYEKYEGEWAFYSSDRMMFLSIYKQEEKLIVRIDGYEEEFDWSYNGSRRKWTKTGTIQKIYTNRDGIMYDEEGGSMHINKETGRLIIEKNGYIEEASILTQKSREEMLNSMRVD